MSRYKKLYKFFNSHYFWVDEKTNKILITEQIDTYGDKLKNPEKNEEGLLYVDFETIEEKNWKIKNDQDEESTGSYYKLPVLTSDDIKRYVIISDIEFNWLKDLRD